MHIIPSIISRYICDNYVYNTYTYLVIISQFTIYSYFYNFIEIYKINKWKVKIK